MIRRACCLLWFSFLFLICSPSTSLARAQDTDDSHKEAVDIFRQLIEINTTDSVGSVTAAARAMQQRFLDAGFPAADVQLLGPNDRKQNLVVRYHGASGKKPILLIGHLDVVEARREDWTTDPFQFVTKDSYYYGRGTQDMKEADAILVETLLRIHREGFRPDRDIILALTADEEGGKSNGVDWLIKNHRDLIDADYVLNPDGGGVELHHAKATIFSVDASEKLYADYQFTVTNPGGHSSLPVPDNAIYELAAGLGRLSQYSFPTELNGVTRDYFQTESKIMTGQTAADMRAILKTPPDPEAVQRLSQTPEYNSTLRTTCVATRLDAGHANNALPQRAQAIVNCRILPGHSKEEVRQDLIRVLDSPKIPNGSKILVQYVGDGGEGQGVIFDKAPDKKALPPAAIKPEVMQALEQVAGKMWPGVPVVSTMADGASDGIYTNGAGMPTYGVSGIALESDDVRAHGKDERLPVASYDRGVDFYYDLLKTLTAAH
ncbi:MAG TPA: M20/M25/M40 family metallo-hydrolase [Acidobacteriaceae bacterium]|jgi:acetylornithine deacetylase/succinyl-diaminopimelate desuccinylase-like protein|nr:M20/M25/M40 family metallo-hydrolase [Acidobacteriaceae bacterium]